MGTPARRARSSTQGRQQTPTKPATPATEARAALAWLKRSGTRKYRDGLARYAIVAPKAFGVSVGALRQYAKRAGRSHELAAELWKSGWYEARMLACMVDEPARVTPAQMDRWARDFDNWAICDTACFDLFDRTPHAFRKVAQWSSRREEFVKRASFALLASVALHDKKADDAAFRRCLPLIERAATDERNFVKKGVNWALRAIGRRNSALHTAAVEVARGLAESEAPAPRWVGKDALRELASAAVMRRLAAK